MGGRRRIKIAGLTTVTARTRHVQHLNPAHLVTTLWSHRRLIVDFAKREVVGRYKGSFGGVAWSAINPIVLLLVYTFVFGIVFQLRWPHEGPERLRSFALVLLCGLTAFNLFGESVSRAPGIITAVPNFVKKVVFPLEILPVAVFCSAAFHAAVSLTLLLAANLFVNQTLHWTVVFLPVAGLPLVFLSLGVMWFLASLGVFVRDVHHAVGLAVQALLFTTPVFYPLESVPPGLQRFILVNPLAGPVDDFRRAALWGLPPDWLRLGLWVPLTAVVMVLGYAWFMSTKRALADVI